VTGLGRPDNLLPAPLKSPLSKGRRLFSSVVAPQRGVLFRINPGYRPHRMDDLTIGIVQITKRDGVGVRIPETPLTHDVTGP